MQDEEADNNLSPLPLVPWVYNPQNQPNMAGVLLIPRVSNFRVTIAQFRQAIDSVDAKHNVQFLQHVPHVIADDEAFSRTAQHFRHNNGSLLRVPQPAARNPRYTWAAQVVNTVTEMVSMEGRAWLEFRRDQKNKAAGTVYYSTQQDNGFAMPPDVAKEFDDAFNRNKLTFGTADCRTLVAAMLTEMAAKLIGRNIWFIPATAQLEVFADLMNAINKLAGYTALVVFEITKTQQNDTMTKQVITEVFKRQLAESVEAINEYVADMDAYMLDPKNNKMRYKSRASRNLSDVTSLIRQTKMYAEIMDDVATTALDQAEELQRRWQTMYTQALMRDGEFDRAAGVLNVMELKKPKSTDENT